MLRFLAGGEGVLFWKLQNIKLGSLNLWESKLKV